jgi:Predicted membrane protein
MMPLPMPAPAAVSVPPAVEATRWIAVASLLALIVLGLAWELWLAPLRPGGSLWALKVLPLCLPLAGLLRRRMYTYRWVSLMVWIYFAEGAVRAYSDRGLSARLALLEAALCLLLFAACVLHVRMRLGRAPS